MNGKELALRGSSTTLKLVLGKERSISRAGQV